MKAGLHPAMLTMEVRRQMKQIPADASPEIVSKTAHLKGNMKTYRELYTQQEMLPYPADLWTITII